LTASSQISRGLSRRWATPELGPVREGRQRAEGLRFEKNLGPAPIRDLFGFLDREFPDLLVVRKAMPSGPEGALLRVGSRSLAVVNSHDQFLARQRFTAAHELAHYLFDSARFSHNIDATISERREPVEQRANSFAIHFLLPAAAARDRFQSGTLDLADDESLVSFAMEYGVSIQSLAWHLRNVLGVSEADRKRMASIESPFKVAVRLGLIDRVQQEFGAKGVTRWPRRYVRLALKGFESGRVSRPELASLLEDQRLTADLEALLNTTQ